MSTETTKQGVWSKATIAGFLALAVGLTVAGVGVYQFIRDGKTDLLMVEIGAALGYLYPKQK